MKKVLLVSLLGVVITVTGGCPSAGRDPNPIATHMPGDDLRSCGALKIELDQIKTAMQELKPKTNKFWTNTIWFIVWAPLMDVKDAEKIEYDAFERRYNRLLIIAKDKNCDTLKE